MPRPPGPTMRKRALGKELRKLREAAGVTAETAAAELDCSVAKVRHIENGRNVVKKTELSALVRLYQAEDTLAELEETRREASQSGWWSATRLPAAFQTYIGAEADATLVRAFAGELIPGLLQVEEYIRDLNRVAGITNADPYVQIRLRRQERLSEEIEPLSLHAICSESAIHRLAHLPCAKDQLRHLLTMSERPNITIQVLPFSAGLHISMMGGFVILDFDPEVSLPAAYLENFAGGNFADDKDTVGEMTSRFIALSEQSMSPQDTARFLKESI